MSVADRIESPLLKQDVAAQFLGVTPHTLETWRHKRKGPPYIKVGRLVYYRESALAGWLDEHTVRPER